MGLSPNYWGRQGWHFIHMVALNYPQHPTEEDKKNYLNFLNSLVSVLPCPICGVHFAENLKKNPPRLESQYEFFRWTVDVHNAVNISNNKEVMDYDTAYEQVMKNAKANEAENLKRLGSDARFLLRLTKNNKRL
jgi:FAD-linked sulfhydryl oxidase